MAEAQMAMKRRYRVIRNDCFRGVDKIRDWNSAHKAAFRAHKISEKLRFSQKSLPPGGRTIIAMLAIVAKVATANCAL